MQSCLLQNEAELQSIREFIQRLPELTLVDFEEMVLISAVRATLRLWKQEGQLAGFAYIDEYNNLWFETDPAFPPEQLEKEIVDWGVQCIRERNQSLEEAGTLDASCNAKNARRVEMLGKHGFMLESVRSLQYRLPLRGPVPSWTLPAGFSVRSVAGESEVEALVVLHRAAFGSEYMTVEQRLAMMHVPGYEQDLDLLAVAPDGELAAFCVCGFENGLAYTDPIGTHPKYRKLGLGKALVTAGLQALQARGAQEVKLGTSSQNLAMQRLAETLGFEVVSEKLWFSRPVD
jgi:ribosomal protein S18 acetylase RimI-like enzyme